MCKISVNNCNVDLQLKLQGVLSRASFRRLQVCGRKCFKVLTTFAPKEGHRQKGHSHSSSCHYFSGG